MTEETNIDAEGPGMKEARATLLREHWPPDPSPFRRFLKKAAWYLKNKNASLFRGLDKVSLVVKNPAALLTGVEYIERTRIALALEELGGVPEGAALVDLAKQGMVLRLDNRLQGAGVSTPGKAVETSDWQWDFGPGTTIVNGISNKGMLVYTLAHELQHQQQIKAGLLTLFVHGRMPSPPETVWYNRAIEADATATAVDIAWKLKESGKSAAWDYVRKHDQCSEAARVYAKAAVADPSAVKDGRAKRAAFDSWFVQRQRRDMGQTTSQAYNDPGLTLVPQAEAAAGWLQQGMRMERLTAADIEKLGDLAPLNYLKIPGGRPLDDLYYRKADWNMEEARYLSLRTQEYDSLKKKFNVASARKPEAHTAAQPTGKPASFKDMKVWG